MCLKYLPYPRSARRDTASRTTTAYESNPRQAAHEVPRILHFGIRDKFAEDLETDLIAAARDILVGDQGVCKTSYQVSVADPMLAWQKLGRAVLTNTELLRTVTALDLLETTFRLTVMLLDRTTLRL